MDVVIVHYHAAEKVRDAVLALLLDGAPRIIVADNGSTSAERALLQSLPVTYLAVGRNAGYAGALRAAFPLTTSDFVVVMNEDVLVRPGCLAALEEALQNGAAIAGPLFSWDRDGTLLLPPTEERTRRNELRKMQGRRSLEALERARAAWRAHARRHWTSDRPMLTPSLSGALLAFRRDTWTLAGPIDDAFALYYEENDWLLRIAAAGLRPMYVPAAQAIHLHDPGVAQSPERRKWEAESFVRFGNRHYGQPFLRRLMLLAQRPPMVPLWPPVEPLVLEQPLWLEVTPSPLGFPAAAMRVDAVRGAWPLPRLDHVRGPLFAQLVDEAGREVARGAFPSPPSPTPPTERAAEEKRNRRAASRP